MIKQESFGGQLSSDAVFRNWRGTGLLHGHLEIGGQTVESTQKETERSGPIGRPHDELEMVREQIDSNNNWIEIPALLTMWGSLGKKMLKYRAGESKLGGC